jgi:hypothetical protein
MLLMAVFQASKEGVHVDESVSLELSNGDRISTLNIPRGSWLTINDFENYYSVADTNRFNYGAVYSEAITDTAHPPGYYLLLHTAMSVFPSSAGLDAGLFLNLLLFGLTLLVLQRIGVLIFGNGWRSLLPPILYALSKGAVDIATFVRPYQLAVLAVALFMFALLILIKKEYSFRRALFLAASGLMVMLINYYAIVFLLAGIAGYLLWLVLHKHFRQLLQAIGFMAATLIGLFLLHPSIFNLLNDGRGREAAENLSALSVPLQSVGGELFALYREWVQQLLSSVFNLSTGMPGGRASVLAIVAILAAVFVSSILMLCVKKRRQSQAAGVSLLQSMSADSKAVAFWLGLLLVASLVYFFLIGRIAPYLDDRYMYILYPYFSLLLSVLIVCVGKAFTIKSRYLLPSAVVIFAALLLLSNPFAGKYLRPYETGDVAALNEYSKTPVVVIEDSAWHISNLYDSFTRFSSKDRPLLYISEEVLDANEPIYETALLQDFADGDIVLLIDRALMGDSGMNKTMLEGLAEKPELGDKGYFDAFVYHGSQNKASERQYR